jgi:hypothetical protein
MIERLGRGYGGVRVDAEYVVVTGTASRAAFGSGFAARSAPGLAALSDL